MGKNVLVFILIVINVVGAIITMFIHYKDATFEWASKYGDGIRFARPSDVVFLDCVTWEVELLLFIIELIEEIINNFFNKRHKDKEMM